MTIYLIDGVRVPKTIWERRQVFGEYAAARYWTELPPVKEVRFTRQNGR